MSSFDRLIGRVVRQPSTARTACPSPEALAAYLDRGLDRAAREAVERHASTCSRCAAHLAALVQLEDRLPLGQRDGGAAERPWWLRWRWLTPAAAMVVIFAVWMSLPADRTRQLTTPERPAPLGDRKSDASARAPSGDNTTGRANQTPTEAPSARGERRAQAAQPRSDQRSRVAGNAGIDRFRTPGAAAVSPAPADAASAQPRTGQESLLKSAPAAPPIGTPPATPVAAPPADLQAEATAHPSSSTRSKAETRSNETGEERLERAGASRSDDPRGARKEAKATDRAEPAPQRDAGQTATARDGASGVVGGTAAAPSAAPETEALREMVQENVARSPAAARLVQIRSPDPRVSWRVVDGRIERSTDAGLTWTHEPGPPVPPDVVGSAPGANACWLAGPAGFVLRRDQSGRWTRVGAPAPVALIAIEARSPSEARVTAVDGRRFATADAGRTWSVVP